MGGNFHRDLATLPQFGVIRWPSDGDTAGYRLRRPNLSPVSLISCVLTACGTPIGPAPWTAAARIVLSASQQRGTHRPHHCSDLWSFSATKSMTVVSGAAPGRFLLQRQWDRRLTLIQLHWLPVSYRIKFKLCCLVHATHYGRSPAYLTETVQSVGASRSRCGLRSSSTSSMDYSPPRLRTKFGERAFSHAVPATWNALPDHIRTVADPVKFRKLLKSRHLSQAFNI